MGKIIIKRLLTLITIAAFAIRAIAAPAYGTGTCTVQQTPKCLDPTPCKQMGEFLVCLSGTKPLPVGAVTSSATCWQYQSVYTCQDGIAANTCGPLLASGCTQLGVKCIANDSSGTCTQAVATMRCESAPGTSTTSTVCSAAPCTDPATCFDPSHPPDKDMVNAAVALETQREAGVYGQSFDPTKIELFKGFSEECTVKIAPNGSTIKSCCTPQGGGGTFTNNEILKGAMGAGGAVVKEEFKAGSKYLYDALFQTQAGGELMTEGVAAATSTLTTEATAEIAAASGTQFGAYGFTFAYSAEGGFSFVGFDPYSFMIAVIVAMVMAWLQCTNEEAIMSMKRGQGLCDYTGVTYCSEYVEGTGILTPTKICKTRSEVHCCFNSVLAKIINRQGRVQLGMPMTQCNGFTPAQLESLDFSVMDFSEFIATIRAKDVPAGTFDSKVIDAANQKITDYYKP